MSADAVVGVDERGRDVQFDHFAALHTVVVGQTRSGKTIFSHMALLTAARDPRIRVCGVDPSGLLLHPHRRGEDDPLIHLGTDDPERACGVVESLVRIMDRRIKTLLAHGVDAVPREVLRPAFPKYVIVLEEFAGLLTWLDSEDAGRKAGEKYAPRFKSAVGRLAREAAKASLNLYLVLQRGEAAFLPDRAQLARRVAFRQDNAASVSLLMENATPEDVQRIMSLAPGQGVIWEPGEPLRFLRADLLPYIDYRAAVLAARARDAAQEVVSGGSA
ncbi:hypothetical protein GCM10027421_16160 [Microbacterium shaanxiense]